MKAKLTEIMESIQGEGLLLGSRQIFIRFSGCNLRCTYCDTPTSFDNSSYCLLSKQTGNREIVERLENDLSVEQVAKYVGVYSSQWISLTGGEPLLWAEFIKELAIIVKPQGYKLLLETNGTLFEQLEICLSYIDLISMDFKFPSATGIDSWDKHRQFLSRLRGKPVYVKMVIDGKVSKEEITEALAVISDAGEDIPIILQPVTPAGESTSPDMQILLAFQKICLEKVKDVRIIPQMHNYLGLI